jgi:hypothetical protein
MRRTTIGILATGALCAAGCGGGTTFANNPRPPTPVDVTVYVNNARVSVSPSSVGAGPVIFIVTNQATQTESLSLVPAGGGGAPLATTGPINPQATTQVTVNPSPGAYTITADAGSGSQAAQANPPSIQPATLHVGPARPSASNVLLQP